MEKIKIKLEKERKIPRVLAWKSQLTVTRRTGNVKENTQEREEDILSFEHVQFQIFNICIICRNRTFSLQEKMDIKLKRTNSARYKALETSFFR